MVEAEQPQQSNLFVLVCISFQMGKDVRCVKRGDSPIFSVWCDLTLNVGYSSVLHSVKRM